ncbi:MAG: hypothetical protein K2J60_11050 [Acetatifactor sp.]|nr:hypothetical protein [Acetatifactor sp.]
MADQNALLKALRDSGISITANSIWDTTLETPTTATTTYAAKLNGEAGQSFDITQTSLSADSATFTVYNKTGVTIATITVGGYNKAATANTDYTDTIVFNATTVKASESQSVSAAYYDVNGNKIAVNDLDNYFTTSYAGKSGTIGTVWAKADAPKVYDAVGNVTKLDPAEINAMRDKVGTLALSLHVGADATSNNQIHLNLQSLNAKGLGINGLRMDGNDDSNALDAIEKIKAAITKVSAQRSELGAIQNRLEHTISNLDNIVENTTSAESQIRDTDMATEMVAYSNNNILAQAGQSMLAQANQANQGVLSLLQ